MNAYTCIRPQLTVDNITVFVEHTFKQLRKALYKWAAYFCKKYRGRFELDELVNAVWVRGKVQKVPKIEMASSKIRWEMLSYIASELKLRKVNSINFFTNFDSLYDNVQHHEDDELAKLYSQLDDGFDQVDAKDFVDVDFVWPYLTTEQQKIIKLRYYDPKILPGGPRHNNYAMIIGRKLGLSDSGVRNRIARTFIDCRRLLLFRDIKRSSVK